MVQDSELSGGAPFFQHVLVFTSKRKMFLFHLSSFLCKNILLGLALQIYSVYMFKLNESATCLVKKELHSTLMKCQIKPRITCEISGFTMKIDSKGP